MSVATNEENTRISLTIWYISVVCKLMGSILRDNIMEHFIANKFFSSKQFGFIKGRLTTLQLLQILDIGTVFGTGRAD